MISFQILFNPNSIQNTIYDEKGDSSKVCKKSQNTSARFDFVANHLGYGCFLIEGEIVLKHLN